MSDLSLRDFTVKNCRSIYHQGYFLKCMGKREQKVSAEACTENDPWKWKLQVPQLPGLTLSLYCVDPRKPSVRKGIQERGTADPAPLLLFSLSLLVEVGAWKAQLMVNWQSHVQWVHWKLLCQAGFPILLCQPTWNVLGGLSAAVPCYRSAEVGESWVIHTMWGFLLQNEYERTFCI